MNKPIPYKGNEPYIFISYSHRDSDRVWPIILRLQQDGYRVWYDEGIDPGTEWDDFIAAQVEHCTFFIAFLTGNYLASDNCNDELKYSRDLKKTQLLIYLEDVQLLGGIAMRLNRRQAIFYHTYTTLDAFFAKLYEARGISICRATLLPPEIADGEATCEAASDGFRAPLGVMGTSAKIEVSSAEIPCDTEVSAQCGCATGETPGITEIPEDWDAEQLFEAGVRLLGQNNYETAIPLLQRAAAQGHPRAQVQMGLCYEQAIGVSKDEMAAVSWFQKAADGGDADGKCHLGRCYEIGLGVLQNLEQAAHWYHDAALQGSVFAQSNIGRFYELGIAVPKDEREAAFWYRKAADWGHAFGQYRLGRLYQRGNGVAKDEREAVKWFTKAAEQGWSHAQYALGCCYEKGLGVFPDNKAAEKWYTAAAKQGHPDAQYKLAELISSSLLSELAPWLHTSIKKWYTAAAKQGHPDAQYKLGVLLFNGRDSKGTDRDLDNAAHWFREAAEQNHEGAMVSLGLCYLSGQGVPKIPAEAARWFHRAAALGNAQAQYLLGMYNKSLHDGGLGGGRFITEAISWFLKAAEQGFADAQYELGVCYAKGKGVPRDKSKAKLWYQKAADQGHKKAKKAVSSIFF